MGYDGYDMIKKTFVVSCDFCLTEQVVTDVDAIGCIPKGWLMMCVAQDNQAGHYADRHLCQKCVKLVHDIMHSAQ